MRQKQLLSLLEHELDEQAFLDVKMAWPFPRTFYLSDLKPASRPERVN